MPKNRKIRVGSKKWAEQKERDIAEAKQRPRRKETPEEKQKRERGERKEWWRKKKEEQERNKEQREKEERREREWKEKDPLRLHYLSILGLTKLQDSLLEIKSAFRRLALQFHPDKNKSVDAEGKMKSLNEAYEILTMG